MIAFDEQNPLITNVEFITIISAVWMHATNAPFLYILVPYDKLSFKCFRFFHPAGKGKFVI